jgi:hypothetical protein
VSTLRSPFLFRSSDRYYAVYGCACSCDGFVKVTGVMEHEAGSSPYWYIRGHQAVGTSYEHIGQRYEFVAEALSSIGRNSSPVEPLEQLLATLPLSRPESASQARNRANADAMRELTRLTEDMGGYDEVPSDWDDDKTPTVQLAWNEWPDDSDV